MSRSSLLNAAPVLILAALIVIASLSSPSFLTLSNIGNLIHYNAELAMVCLGLVLVIVAGNGGIDLSVGATLALTAVLVASYAPAIGLSGSLVLAIGVGAICGLVNGLVIAYGKLEPFIATLVIASITTALTLMFTHGGPILTALPASLTNVAAIRVWSMPLPFYFFILTYLIGFVVLHHTPFGRHLYAMGANAETVRLAGVNVRRVRILIYVISGALAGVAGLLTTARLGMGEPRAGMGVELTAISAVVVGGVSLYGGRGTITGAFIGILVFAVILNLMNILNLSIYYQPVSKGLIVVIAGLLLSRRRTMFAKAG